MRTLDVQYCRLVNNVQPKLLSQFFLVWKGTKNIPHNQCRSVEVTNALHLFAQH